MGDVIVQGARRNAADLQLVGVGLGIGDQILDGLERAVFRNAEQLDVGLHPHDRIELRAELDGAPVAGLDDRHRRGDLQDGVAVRRGAVGIGHAHDGARSALVHDGNRRAQILGCDLGELAGEDVAGATGSERHHHFHRPAREILGNRSRSGCGNDGADEPGRKKFG